MPAITLAPRNDFEARGMTHLVSMNDQENISVSSIPSLSEDSNESAEKKDEMDTQEEENECSSLLNSSNTSPSTGSTYSYGGLQNLGNTCYMNSALQVLASLDGFVEKTRNLEYPGNKEIVNDKLCRAFLKVMDSLARGETVRPEEFKEAMDERSPLFVGYRQQDSHEFLTTLLDLLDEDYKNLTNDEEKGGELEEYGQNLVKEFEEFDGNQAPTENKNNDDDQELESYESDNKKARKEEQNSDKNQSEARMTVRNQSFSELNVEDIEELIHGCTRSDNSLTAPGLTTPSGPRCKLIGGRMSMSDVILSPFPENNVSFEDTDITSAKIGETDELSVESESPPAHEDSSPVEEYFKTEVCVSLTCDSCQYARKHTETYLHLSLEIGTDSGSVEDGLRKFFAPEKRELKCEKCFCETAMQTTEITKLPRALLLHFKRFIVDISPDYMSITYRKNQSSVELEKSLVVGDDFGVLAEFLAPGVSLPKLNERDCDSDELSYSLRSTVNHIGSSAGCGHYTADANRLYSGNKQEWTRFNDSFVSSISEKEVIADCSRTVYMALFELL